VRRALGKDRDRSLPCEHLACGLEGLAVLGRIEPFVLPAVHGNRVEGPTEGADDRHAKQRRLGQERHAARGETKQERRIDEAVGMIQHKHHGALRRYVLETRDFDPPEEHPEHETEQRPEERPHCAGPPPATRPPRHAA